MVGGTGLYFKALTEGLSPVPPIPDAIRAHWRDCGAERAGGGLHRRARRARSGDGAARLRPSDAQRIVRALEVLEATGRSLADWQRMPGVPVVREEAATRLVIELPREELFQRCDRRFDQMMAAGALDEVRALARAGLDPAPAGHAGAGRAAAARASGRWIDLAAAVAAAKLRHATTCKRQQTWLKRHMIAWNVVQLSQ